MYTLFEFSTIFRNKMSHSKRKKVQAIKEYFANINRHTLHSNEPEDLLQEIVTYTNTNPQFEERIFTEVVEILFDRYSLGKPYLVYDATINPNLSFNQLQSELRRLFRSPFQSDMFEFVPDRTFDVDTNAEEVTIKIRYKEYERDIVTDERSENIAVSGQIPIFISKSRGKVLIGTGYLKGARNLVRVINHSLGSTISLNAVDVEDEANVMPNLIANTRFSPLTILAIMLILVKMNANNYIINDLLSISFNNEDAPRVKNAQLGGNHLLDDVDVVHRIYRGDRITHFQLRIVHLNAAQLADLTGDVLFDFRTGFKLQFGESTTGTLKQTTAVMDIESIIRATLNDPTTVSNAMNAIQTRLPNIPVQDQQLMRDILRDIRDNLSSLLHGEKDIMEGYFNRTFRL